MTVCLSPVGPGLLPWSQCSSRRPDSHEKAEHMHRRNEWPFISKSSFHLKAVITHLGKSCILSALIDSRSAGNIMDMATATHLNFPITKMLCSIKLQAIDGRPICSGRMEYCTEHLHMQISSLHQEIIKFLLTDCKQDQIILGVSWLHQHNPGISWTDREIIT